MHRFQLLCMMLLATSCATSAYHTATPIEAGRNEIGVFAGASYLSREPGNFGGDTGTSSERRPRTYPSLDVAYRRGLTNWSDIGVQIGTGLLRVDYNMALVNTDHFALSIDPQLDSYLRLAVGLYADVIKTRSGTLTLNVSPGFHFIEGGPVVGAGLLLKLPIGSFSLLVFSAGEMVVGRDRKSQDEWARLSVTGGLGLAYGF